MRYTTLNTGLGLYFVFCTPKTEINTLGWIWPTCLLMLISAARNGGALLGFLQNIYKLRFECCLFANAEQTNIFFSSKTRPLTSTVRFCHNTTSGCHYTATEFTPLGSHTQTHLQIYDFQRSIVDLLPKVISSSQTQEKFFYMLLTTFYVSYASFFRIYLYCPWLDFGCQNTRLLLYGKLVPRKLGY